MTDEKTATSGDFVRDLGEAIRANPLPAALIGIGLAWLFAGGASSVKAGFGGAWDGGSKEGVTTRGLGRSFDEAATSAGESLSDRSAVAQKASDVAFRLG